MVGENSDENHQTEQVAIRIRKGLHAEMRAARTRGCLIGYVWTRAAETFLSLPRDVQLTILQDEESVESLTETIARLVDERIADAAMRAAAEDEQAAYEASRKGRQGKRARKTG